DWIHKYIRPLTVNVRGADDLRDDVALLQASPGTIVTMDTLVEGQHFLRGDPLNTVGQKLVRVNVSDIHAKGAVPKEALLSIAWPKGRGETEFADLMAGIKLDLKAFGIDLLGGDTVLTHGPLVLTLSLTGACLRDGPVRRAAQAPDGATLWLSGPIGGGSLGLRAAREGGAESDIRRYRCPPTTKRMHAEVVAEAGLAAIDVSDGLLLDALTLAEINGRGVHINLERVWLYRATSELPLLMEQVTGGDDYQILMIAKDGVKVDPEAFLQIGYVKAESGLSLSFNGVPVDPPNNLGFDHET
ncbi:MAG: thiamine-phosphate kinase, partial [Pseudomonadota bacterium]